MKSKQCEMIKIKPYSISPLLVILLFLHTSCGLVGTKPEEALWGTWSFTTSSDVGEPAFAYDLIFGQDGTLYIPGSSDLKTSELAFTVIAPGRIKISALDQSEVLNYELTGDTLKLFFGGGYNLYTRASEPEQVAQVLTEMPVDTFSVPTSTPADPSALGWLIKEDEVITPENAHQVIEMNRMGISAINNEVFSLNFSPNGMMIASGGSNGRIYLWDTSTGNLLQTHESHINTPIDGISSVELSPNGKKVASCGIYDSVHVWEPVYGNLIYTYRAPCIFLSFSPNGQFLAVSNNDGKVHLIDADKGYLLHQFEEHLKDVFGIMFSPDGKSLASGSLDGSVRIWDVESKQSLHTLQHPSSALRVVFSPDGDYLISAGDGFKIQIWDPSSGRLLNSLEMEEAAIIGVAFSPDGKILALASGEHEVIHLYETAHWQKLAILRGHQDQIWDLKFSPDGTMLASASIDGTIRLWGIP